MGMIAYLATLGLFAVVVCWCWVTKTFTPHRVGLLMMLTISQLVLAIYIDQPVGVIVAAASVGIEIFVLVDMYERTFNE